MAILNKYTDTEEKIVKHNIKASLVTINFTRPALLALKYDFQNLQFDTKQEKKLNQEFISKISSAVNELTKVRIPLEKTMQSFNMSADLSDKSNEVIDLIYDMLSMSRDEVTTLKKTITRIKNKRNDINKG